MKRSRTKGKLTVAEKIERNAEAIRRWERRATRAISALARLTKERTRLQRLAATPAVRGIGRVLIEPVAPAALPAPAPAMPESAAVEAAMWKPGELEAAVADALGGEPIPGFLRRGRSKEDQAAIDQAKADKADRAKRKRAGQDATRKARRSGATRAMPLQGKAALAAIRGETP